MGKPGIMFYFDVRPCIKRLTLDEKGQLFEAILDYGEFGNLPNFDDRLGIAWDFIQPKLDKDSELYGHKVLQRQYAVYVREARKQDSVPISFDEWLSLSDDEKNRLLSADIGSYPTSTPTPTSTSTDSEADKPPAHRKFVPPTVQEVAGYCQEKGYAVDAERFVSYYEAIGWKVGRNPMKSWQAAVRTWASKEKPTVAPTTPGNCGYVLAPQEDPWDELMKNPEQRKAAGYSV